MRRATCPAILVVFLVLGWATNARAQGSAAEALFDQGRKALAAGDLETACARFRASDKIDPAPGTKANLADCEERRGKLATAWELNRTALAKLPASDPRAVIIKQRIAKLEPRLPKLLLTLADGAPKETTVREGDTTLGSAETFGVPLPLDPGEHHMTVLAPGRPSRDFYVTLTEGKTATVSVAPGAVEATPVEKPTADKPDPVPQSTDKRVPQPSDSPSPGPWIVGGMGLAALVAGAVTGGLVVAANNTYKSNCHPATLKCDTADGQAAVDRVKTLGPTTTVLLVVGGAAVAAGGIWLAVRPPTKANARIGVGPVIGGAAWRVEGSW